MKASICEFVTTGLTTLGQPNDGRHKKLFQRQQRIVPLDGNGNPFEAREAHWQGSSLRPVLPYERLPCSKWDDLKI